MSDLINKLPTDTTVPNHKDLVIVNELFKNHDSTMTSIANEFQEPFIYTIIFIILSLPLSSRMVNYCVPSIENDSKNLFMIGIKAMIFLLLIYIIQNYSKIKK